MPHSDEHHHVPHVPDSPPAAAADAVEERWESCAADPALSTPPSMGRPGNAPPGEDLDLHIGWDRFEKLLVAVCRGVRGLRETKFRRYGVEGQAQHGIDLAGREPDGSYTVVQCKDYQTFTTTDLRAAVTKFTTGKRPFDARRLIIATSAETRTTQLEDELGKLQNAHDDLDLELWGSEQINEYLRYLGDVVARFWTRETAETFCTGAPLPGVPVPLPDRQEWADKILVGPLRTSDVVSILRRADEQVSTIPEESARLYGELARRLDSEDFRGHAAILRGKQLDALVATGHTEKAIVLAAELAVAALHYGIRDEPRKLIHRIRELAQEDAAPGVSSGANVQRHVQLVRAAVDSAFHPLGHAATLVETLRETVPDEPAYQPLLVLLAAENLLVTDSDSLKSFAPVIDAAIEYARSESSGQVERVTEDAVMRLRLVRAEYDDSERIALRKLARYHQVPGRHAALINAREARRCALEGRAESAVECWRDAVHEAINAGLPEDAADWLYAIRAVNVQYGPITSDIDDEHRLAQALRTTGRGRLLSRVRSPREQALSAVVAGKPVEAALSARRWLTDTVITGNWASETEALTLLGDLYRDSGELNMAAQYFQLAGRAKKLEEIAGKNDHILPVGPLSDAPWWTLHARAALIAAQADLLDDDAAAAHLTALLALTERGRMGELMESPLRHLTHQATRSACSLGARGTPDQAQTLLDLLAADVPRGPHQYHFSDDGHATGCVAIAKAHSCLTANALTRLFDLTDGGVDKALKLVVDDEVVELLTEREDLISFRARVSQLDDKGLYLADIALMAIAPEYPAVLKNAEKARDRILRRSAPEPGHAELGTRLVEDSYLVGSLHINARKTCLERLMDIAADPREIAMARQDAITGAGNLVIDLPIEVQRQTFLVAKEYALGRRDGSYLDGEVTGSSHPLSSFKFSGGSASLRGKGLRLTEVSATEPEDHVWVRVRAISLLSEHDNEILHDAAMTLSRLPHDVTSQIDPGVFAAHSYAGVRQAGAVLCMRHPARHRDTALRLARDGNFRVRRVLAEAAVLATTEAAELSAEVLQILARDVRHSVRAASTGARSRKSGVSN
ncbi:hypothetical protein [Streptomyces sp. NPDC127119]|uniref:hypothetical protein n=1 Tax=Streptomyces sp. NPDC127119 TaxID=3345370 RepID=UPI00362CD533